MESGIASMECVRGEAGFATALQRVCDSALDVVNTGDEMMMPCPAQHRVK